MQSMKKPPRVAIETPFGRLIVEVYPEDAPISAGNFLAYVDAGRLDGSTVYRIVTLANQPPEKPCKIEVVQWGWRLAQDDPGYFPPIPHEPTSVTGIRHKHGTLSHARREPGTAAGAFFFCIGNQPELDEHGKRNPDGHGFAAFGQLVEGEEVLAALFAQGEASEQLQNQITIQKVRRV